MPDPFSRQGPTAWPQGAGGSPDNIGGLASGQARCVGVLGPVVSGSPLGDIILGVWKITFVSPPTSGALLRYVLGSEDNTTPLWPGGISPISSADQSPALLAATGVDTGFTPFDQLSFTPSNTATTFYLRWEGLRGLFTNGNVPTFTTICVYLQGTGVAIATTSAGNNITQYSIDVYV